MGKLYSHDNPPKRGMALHAWRYFTQLWGRKIMELSYSPNIHYDGPGWVCEYQKHNEDFLHWGVAYGTGPWTKHIHSWQLKEWIDENLVEQKDCRKDEE